MTDTISNRSSGLEGLNQKGGFGRTLELFEPARRLLHLQ